MRRDGVEPPQPNKAGGLQPPGLADAQPTRQGETTDEHGWTQMDTVRRASARNTGRWIRTTIDRIWNPALLPFELDRRWHANCAGRSRTCNHLLNRQPLCQLSYGANDRTPKAAGRLRTCILRVRTEHSCQLSYHGMAHEVARAGIEPA